MDEQISNLLRQWNLPQSYWIFILVTIAVLLGLLLKFIFSRVVKKKTKDQGNYSLFSSFIFHLSNPLNVFLPLFFLNLVLPVMDLPTEIEFNVGRAIEVALIITFAWLFMNVLNVVQAFVIHQFDFSKEDNLRERKARTQLQFIRRIANGVIIIVTISAVLLSFDRMRKIGTGLLTGVGISGIIVGFAAQRSLGNLLAGFQIAFTQPIRIDDVLVVEGEFGRVEEITLTYVVLRIWDERRLILPINYFIEKPFENWTRTGSEILGTVFIYTDYTIPVDEVRKEFTRLITGNRLWNGKVSGLAVTNAKNETVELRALVSANDSGEAFDLRCEIREGLITFIKNNYPECLPRTRNELQNVVVENQNRPSDTNTTA